MFIAFISQLAVLKPYDLPHMHTVDLKQMQQNYGMWVTLRGGCTWEGQGKGRKLKT
jgi:uncharacterized protein involved in tolerance to divalent cations